jgi:hypothetical protein
VILNGLLDGSAEDIARTSDSVAEAMKRYAQLGAESNLVMSTHKCGHACIDEFKWLAYQRLKQYFGMQPARSGVNLGALVRGARDRASWAWGNDDSRFPQIGDEGTKVEVLVDGNMESALSELFVHLAGKIPLSSSLHVEIGTDVDCPFITCTIPGGDDSVIVGHNDTRYSERICFENRVALKREQTSTGLLYILRFEFPA